jgi:molybdopterin-guanine dinucleotide biosynthesis protein A
MTTVLAGVLAGGRSTRFGSDKALADVQGVPMAVRVVEVLVRAGCEVRLVARHARNLGVAEILEPYGPRHPLFGVAALLAEAETRGLPGAFVATCDAWPLDEHIVGKLLDARALFLGDTLLISNLVLGLVLLGAGMAFVALGLLSFWRRG